MEPLAEFFEDLFIVCYAARYWLLALLVSGPGFGFALSSVFRTLR